jgi:hypothetical protein
MSYQPNPKPTRPGDMLHLLCDRCGLVAEHDVDYSRMDLPPRPPNEKGEVYGTYIEPMLPHGWSHTQDTGIDLCPDCAAKARVMPRPHGDPSRGYS